MENAAICMCTGVMESAMLNIIHVIVVAECDFEAGVAGKFG